MRIQSVAFANARAPQNLEKVQFQGLGKLRLRNKIFGKGEFKSGGICLQEMSLIFSCFKKNNFKEDLCQEELLSFKRCFEAVKNPSGMESESKKPLSKLEVNNLLQRFPNK